MFRFLMRWIFLDKRGRAVAKELREAKSRRAQSAPPDDGQAAEAGDRDELIKQTMALYRQRRAEYEQLDEGVRDKLTKLADDKLRGKDS